MHVIAQTQKPAQTTPNTSRPRFIPPKVPIKIGAVSGRRTGMGSRANCPAVTTELTALVPSESNFVGGLTVSEKPSFWFYVPYTNNLSGANAHFTLLDDAGNKIYNNPIALPGKPSLVSVTLPSNIPLQENKTYGWYLKVHCTQQNSPRVPIYVEGKIQRIKLNPTITQELETATPQQKAMIYAANGIWFDSINTLAQLRLSNFNDKSIESDWKSLLQSVGLESVNNFPFSQSVTN